MDEETRALSRLFDTLQDGMAKIVDHINNIEHRLTPLDNSMKVVVDCLDSHKAMIEKQEELRLAIERRLDHIETYLNPINSFANGKTTASKGGNPDE